MSTNTVTIETAIPKSPEQQRIENYFMWAFDQAARVREARRAQQALHFATIDRMRSREGRVLGTWQAMLAMQQQLAKAGVKSQPIVRPDDKRIGISIQYRGIGHKCFSRSEIDAVLTMIATAQELPA